MFLQNKKNKKQLIQTSFLFLFLKTICENNLSSTLTFYKILEKYFFVI